MENHILNWCLTGLLGLGLLVAVINLIRGRAPLASSLFGVLLAAGLWAVLGLPWATAPFTVLGIGVLGCGLGLILARTPAGSAIFMLAAFFCLAAIYLLLGFPFLSMVQLMVYAGAIVVLFLFVVMLLDLSREKDAPSDIRLGLVGPILAGTLTALAITAFVVIGTGAVSESLTPEVLAQKATETTSAVAAGPTFAKLLFEKYLLPFEAITMLLLAALVGVIILTGRPLGATPGEEDEA